MENDGATGRASFQRSRYRIAVAWIVVAAVAVVATGCGRAGGTGGAVPPGATGAPAEPTAHAEPPGNTRAQPDRPAHHGAHLELVAPAEHESAAPYGEPYRALDALRRQGRFDQFVDGAMNAAAESPDSAPLQWLRGEACLALGDNDGAKSSALKSATLALDANDDTQDDHLAVRALRLWLTATLRQGEPLDAAGVEPLLDRLPAADDGTRLVRFWIAALADRQPYETLGSERPEPAKLVPTHAAEGTLWAEMNAVEVTANGATLPMVFVDTGAQHTIMTRRAAQLAGVPVGAANAQLVGFRGLAAQPAVLDSLELGSLKLRNVPVLVGDSLPLVTANGQMALGTELMHHVRFTLDYPQRRVLAERADKPTALHASRSSRQIPLWTFSQACLARGETPRGPARVLIDTGNRSGTYVSARWARHYFPQFRVPAANLIFKFRHQGLMLDRMDLGNAVLVNWPILDRLPNDLERLDLVDVLIGRDMWWPYRVTIDMTQRLLILDGGPDSPTPPTDTIP
ncbi:MAG: retropepsin-like aspartic protease [Pirellulales bacterium]